MRPRDAWRLAKTIYKLKETDKATFFSPTNEWCLPAPSGIKPEERDFVVDSGASMHMLSRTDLNSAELETVKVSENPRTIVTANGEVQTTRGNSVCKRIGFIRDSNASRRYTGSSLTRKTLRRSRVFLPLDQWSETTSHQNGRRIKCNTANYIPIVVPGLSTGSSSSSSATTPTSVLQEAASPALHPASTRSESTSSTARAHPSHEPAETEKKMETTRTYE